MKQGRRYRRFLLIGALCLAMSSSFAQKTAITPPWYSSGLEKLGFTVFPQAQALGDFTVQALGGSQVNLRDQKGKVILLNFWATWCPPCRAEMPAIDKLWKSMKGKAFTVMGISVGESPRAVEEFISKQGYSFPIYVDPSGELGALFGARSIPTTYVLDKSGRAIAAKVGGAPYDSAEALAIFAELASK